MKRLLLYIIMYISFLPFCSCYRDFQIETEDFTPHIVMYSLVQADSLIHFTLSRSWLSGNKPEDISLKKANVSLFVNGEQKDPAITIPRSGDHLRLSIEVEGMPTAYAETVVPQKVEIDTVRYIWNDKSQFNMQIEVTFKDTAGRDDYYGLGLYGNSQYNYSEIFSVDTHQEPLFSYLRELGVLDDMVGSEKFYYVGNLIPFSGQSIDGQTYTLRVTLRKHLWDNLDNVLICLYSFSPSYYTYLLSLLRIGINVLSDFGLADPNLIYKNVENGLGIFGACQLDTVHISLK